MRRVMAVAFEPHGRLYYLDPGDAEHAVGDAVLFPTEHGPAVARCVWGPVETAWDDGALPRCAGPATPADLARDAEHRARRAEIWAVARRLIADHRLEMTVVAVDHVDDGADGERLAVVYFKAPQRVDFRALLPDLARALAARIDLRQVGPRDVAALTGDVAACGRELCCCAMCPAAEALTPRAAREQESANQALQYAGTCGRLKCCIAYEQDAYVDFAARAPRVGSVVATAAGEGVVSGHAVPADALWVRTQDGLRAVPLADAEQVAPAPELPEPSAPAGAAAPPEPRPHPPRPAPGRRQVFPRRPRRRNPEA